MTDLERLLGLLDDRAVTYTLDSQGDQRYSDGPAVTVDNWSQAQVWEPGYNGFVSTWYFDKAGELVAVGSWE